TRHYSRLIEEYPESPYVAPAQFNLALAYKKLGKLDMAQYAYQKYVAAAKPGDAQAQNALWETYQIQRDRKDFDGAVAHVRGLVGAGARARRRVRRVHIPACYDEDFGPDLAEAARLAGMSRKDAIRLHASVDYHVYMLGFLPGFAYMGDVPEPLRMPRIQTPRVKVPARSLGLAFGQTGIYPLESPGGWRLIGVVPVELCDIHKSPPALLAPGDLVRFHPIDRTAFDTLRAEWIAGKGRVEIEETVA
ncbi:MAG: 5-oxoprolinase subunit PxpB, partial [Pseudomonadota bacterium]